MDWFSVNGPKLRFSSLVKGSFGLRWTPTVARLLLLGLFGVASAIGGCSTPSDLKDANDGGRQNESRSEPLKREGGPLWNIELVAATGEAWKHKSYDVPALGNFSIVGWAVDQEAKAAAGGVDIVIDGKAYAAIYGQPRPDVSADQKNPAYTDCGYTLALSGEQFQRGTHTMVVRVLSNDHKGFWEAGPYMLNFK